MVGHHPATKTGIKRLCVYALVVLYPHDLSEGDITNDNNALKSLKQLPNMINSFAITIFNKGIFEMWNS